MGTIFIFNISTIYNAKRCNILYTIIGVIFIIICIILIYLDIHYKILNVIKIRQNLLNKSNLITNRRTNGFSNKSKYNKRYTGSKSSDTSRKIISGSMLSGRTDSQLTFNMDI